MTTRQFFTVLGALLLATPALAAIKWRGDFETGDLSQWGQKQIVSADRFQVVSSPVHQGSKAVKVTVIQGDDPINSSGNRSEVVRKTQEPEGSDIFYRWQTMFATDFPSANTWQLFTQWHQPEDTGSPPIEFFVRGETIRLQVGPTEKLVWSVPLVRGVWHDFIFHVKFSDDATKGFVELWFNGTQVLQKTFTQTRAMAWLKQGLYRDESIAQTGVLYHDGMVIGDTYADVLGAYGPTTPTNPPDAGTTPTNPPDAGTTPTNPPDAGTTPTNPPDAGTTPTNPPDAGTTPTDPVDAGTTPTDPVDAGTTPTDPVDAGTTPTDPDPTLIGRGDLLNPGPVVLDPLPSGDPPRDPVGTLERQRDSLNKDLPATGTTGCSQAGTSTALLSVFALAAAALIRRRRTRQA